MTAWSTAVWPERTAPSTGMVSPGSTRSTSPTATSSAGISSSPSAVSRRAVLGVRWTSFSMPARARATVSSSSREPSCMIKAISPAAKISPMATEAMRARDTSTSALMSNRVNRPTAASFRMGTPHSRMAAQAGSTGKSPKKLHTSESPPTIRNAISRFIYPYPLWVYLYPQGYSLSRKKCGPEEPHQAVERFSSYAKSARLPWQTPRWCGRRRRARCRPGRSG